jgi:ureidoglycolate lyase
VIRLVAEKLTAEAFGPFGFVREIPKGGLREGPFAPFGDTRPNAQVNATLISCPARQGPRSIRDIERHLHGSQFFIPLGGELSLVVFPGGDEPDLAMGRAFIAAPNQAFGYRKGVWHAGVAAAAQEASVASLLSRDGTPADVDERRLAEAIEVVFP